LANLTHAEIEAELAALSQEYAAWNETQRLSLGSADEHLFDVNLTSEQREWLRNFSRRWEGASPVHPNGKFIRHRDLLIFSLRPPRGYTLIRVKIS
jgi:hypothetical protein